MSAGWGFVCGGEFLFYAFAYDKAFATYSPSRLFVENLLQHCFRNGIRTFDFMPGDVPYKRIWATRLCPRGVLHRRAELARGVAAARLRHEARLRHAARAAGCLSNPARPLARCRASPAAGVPCGQPRAASRPRPDSPSRCGPRERAQRAQPSQRADRTPFGAAMRRSPRRRRGAGSRTLAFGIAAYAHLTTERTAAVAKRRLPFD